MQYIAILGRQPNIGMAELERVFGETRWFSHDSVTVTTDSFDIQRLGGTVKAGHIVAELKGADWRKASIEIVRAYTEAWKSSESKITLGISAYGFKVSARDVQRTGLILKSKLKAQGVSLRLIPNEQPILNTATAHHNKLGLSPNKVELMVIRGHSGNIIIAESTGSQNITHLSHRDQGRPARDAFVGMLPPKLAMIMVNLSIGNQLQSTLNRPVILDPFCGTGVLLQEALLLGCDVQGSDLSEKMVDYSKRNLTWLSEKFNVDDASANVKLGDAMDTTWTQPIDAVACETYLGQPFSAPPRTEKLLQVQRNCDHIIGEFLRNLSRQLQPGTPLCVAIPAWNDGTNHFTHLSLITKLSSFGFKQVEFHSVNGKDLLYYREDQVVARELLVLEKI